jgi:hypothetical protein
VVNPPLVTFTLCFYGMRDVVDKRDKEKQSFYRNSCLEKNLRFDRNAEESEVGFTQNIASCHYTGNSEETHRRRRG